MGWKRRSIIATAAGTIVGATNSVGLPALLGSEMDIVEERAATVTLPAGTFRHYELADGVEYIEWTVALTDLTPLIDVYVMTVQAFQGFPENRRFSYEHTLSATEAYQSERSGWVPYPSSTYVLVFENPSPSEAVEVSFTYTGKRGGSPPQASATGAYHVQPGSSSPGTNEG